MVRSRPELNPSNNIKNGSRGPSGRSRQALGHSQVTSDLRLSDRAHSSRVAVAVAAQVVVAVTVAVQVGLELWLEPPM